MERYKPGTVANLRNQKEIVAYIQQEFERISTALEGALPQELEAQSKEPPKKKEGLIVLADGKNWDPGSGKGVYLWMQSQWHHIPMSPLSPDLPQPPVEEPPQPPVEEPPPDEEPPPPGPVGPLPPEEGIAVPTFHCMGLTWRPPSDPGAAGAKLEYRKRGQSVWKLAMPMPYDGRNGECRGSVFWLDTGTVYEFQFSMPGGSPIGSAVASTWSETFPEGEVVRLPNGVRDTPLVITSGGTRTAYKVYTHAEGGASTINVGNRHAYNIEVRAPYVIIRGLTLTGAQRDAIRLENGTRDLVIEHCDISNWGRRDASMSDKTGWDVAVNGDSAIHAWMISGMDRVVVQYNHIHDPRYGTNPWDKGHPRGPNGVMWENSGNNHVIRFNTIDSTDKTRHDRYYMDSIGGGLNFDEHGYPGADSDIYGNYIWGCMDDPIEAEGGGKNVRVWGNYMDACATGVASTVVHRGPLYVFRNVLNRTRFYWITRTHDNDTRAYFSKSATLSNWGRGMRYVIHNTTLQAPPPAGSTQLSGIGSAISGLGSNQPLTHTVSRNNIWHTWKDHWSTFVTYGGTEKNSFDYDLYNANMISGHEANGIKGKPTYKAGHGAPENSATVTGQYQLEPGTPGHDDGEVLSNLNSESYLGTAPDMGAHEEGTPDLEFGHTASGMGVGAPL